MNRIPECNMGVRHFCNIRTAGIAFLVAVAMTLACLALPAPARAATYTVTLGGDTGAVGELRWAIEQVNLGAGGDTIDFDIPGAGPHTIAPLTPLPLIAKRVSIDATTQGGWVPPDGGSADLMIVLDGSSMAGAGSGLDFVPGSESSTVRGLVINNFPIAGVNIVATSGVQVAGCNIGTNQPGTAAAGNVNGVNIFVSTDCTIGGASPADRNVISGNTADGVYVEGSDGNGIYNNFIGTDAFGWSGDPPMGNEGSGVYLITGSDTNNIGAAGMGNVISGNDGSGVYMEESQRNIVRGNRIGTSALGQGMISNIMAGVMLGTNASENQIGGAATGQGNLISGNFVAGVALQDAGSNQISGNLIGTDVAGTAAIPNIGIGVHMVGEGTNNNVVGGPVAPYRNVISGNWVDGVRIENAPWNTVSGNYIGCASDGSPLGNMSNGVLVADVSPGTVIGDLGLTTPARGAPAPGVTPVGTGGNVISNNVEGDGVAFSNSADGFVCGNTIHRNGGFGVALYDNNCRNDVISFNSMYRNNLLGISLGGVDTPTPNDGNNNNPAKPNRGYNYPEFSSPTFNAVGGSVEVTGTAPPDSRVEIFATGAVPDKSSHGQGQSLLGWTTADASGNFARKLDGIGASTRISATATSPDTAPSGPNNTSEFSANVMVVATEISVIKSVESENPVPGGVLTYTVSIKNNGAGDAAGLSLKDEIPEGTEVVAGSVKCSDAGAKVESEDPVEVKGITVKAGKTVTVTFDVVIDEDVKPGTVIENQGVVRYEGTDFLSSDPGHPGDGRPTAITIGAGKGSTSWFLAEGSTGGGFDTWILVQNPGGGAAEGTVTFSTESGPLDPVDVSIPPQARTTVRVADYVPETWGVSTIIEMDSPVVAERSLYWDKDRMGDTDIPGSPQPFEMRGGHSNLGVPVEEVGGLAGGSSDGGRTHYFPEGATAGGFDTWILLVNPGGQPADAKVTLMTGDGPAVEKDVNVGPLSRQTVHLDEYMPDAFEVATQVQSNVPLVAERSMYWDPDEADLEPYQMIGGHSNAGSPVPDKEWHLAEGSTAEGFETYYLLQNPNDGEAEVELTWMTGTGVAKVTNATMPAQTRATFKASDYVPGEYGVSLLVHSDAPVVAERSMYWDTMLAAQPYEMRDGSSTVGARHDGSTWLVPEGSTGGGFETFVLIANTDEEEADVTVTFMLPGGAVEPVDIKVPAQSRYTVRLSDYVPDQFEVSTLVVSNADLVVEHSMYWDMREKSPFGDFPVRPFEAMGGSSAGGLDP